MNDRDIAILTEIIKHPNLRSKELEEKFKLTKRQLSYSIMQINKELENSNLPRLQRTPLGTISATAEIANYLVDDKEHPQQKYIYHTEQQRSMIIVLYVLTSDGPLSLINIYHLLKVSQATAAKDMRNVKRFLNERHLKLKNSWQNGYWIEGNELNQRSLINEAISNLEKYADSYQIINDLTSISIDEVIHFVRQMEHRVGISYSDNAFNYLVYSLVMNIARNESSKVQDTKYFFNQISDTKEFKVISQLINSDWIRSQSDIEWISILFLSANTIRGEFSFSDYAILKAITKMVSAFEQKTLVKIQNHEEFEKRLLAHLRPAVYRVKYGLHLKDVDVSQISIAGSQYEFLASSIRKIISPLEKIAGKKFPEEEIKLIVFYFGGDLENAKSLSTIKPKAAVVCTNGVIVSKLMFQNLVHLFPEITFLSATSVRDFEAFSSDYDLVFTTVPLRTKAKQYIIRPISPSEDAMKLRYRVLSDFGLKNMELALDQITQIVRRHTKSVDVLGLKSDLKHWLSTEQSTTNIQKEVPNLSAYLSPQFIRLIDKKTYWQEALCTATEPLIHSGIVNQDYLDTIVKNTASRNNYSFLGSRIAIPHTTSDHGILQDGFGFTVFKQAVKFPTGQNINIIVPIAIYNTKEHLRAIEQLTSIASDDKLISTIISASDTESIYRFIKSKEKETKIDANRL
ncbi:BglG family transcription antiterminator [Oenococcus oeni]|uniref:BglG family transcription antiterminator n=1 Tax=Oenococcus oeni TaxID=1247 RepID=UPI0015D665ED|nr:BglG family transcription antiterminator [Oenococcus oeni]